MTVYAGVAFLLMLKQNSHEFSQDITPDIKEKVLPGNMAWVTGSTFFYAAGAQMVGETGNNRKKP